MRRRAALRSGVALFGGATFAGCLDGLDTLGSESAWRDLVVDRPDEIYVPPKVDGMLDWGTVGTDGYALSVSATRPHRFWTIAGRETNQIAMREAHSVHLMVSVLEPDTRRFVPAEVRVSIRRGDDRVLDRALWPMLSQRMAIHYGDNVALPDAGRYRVVIRVLPRGTGRFSEAFEPTTVTVEFEYVPDEIEGVEQTIIEESRRGRPGAVEPMGHSRDEAAHTGPGGHPPITMSPSPASFPAVLADEIRGDYRMVVARADHTSGRYLFVSPRTRYNGFPLPFASFTARIERPSGTTSLALTEATHPAFGHHYGAVVDPLSAGTTIAVDLDVPPQVARHEGYETALFDLRALSLRVP
ncbi:iron transporter [Halalkalicoccus subterraneus]|uniref:iron transporter n=1 Tax=Halalkalicoccus subterraneus TaxID=2675002 RepID=UPI000EFBBFBD|nr:iron transporter [Halalkalicoccus subterraneus]